MYQRKFLHSAVLTVTLLVAARDCFGQSTERNLVRSDPVLLLPLNEAAPTGNAGLFVGINEFTVDRHISGLQFAVHDAIELAYLFVVDLKLISPRSCHLLLSGQSSADDVQRHLAELRQQGCVIGSAQRSQILAAFLQVTSQGRGTSDVLVCAFSSHGFNQGRQAYIMPSDGARELLQDTAIPVDSIETRMEASKAGHRLLLVDACQERISARSTAGAVTGTPMSPLFLELLKLPTGQAKLASCSPGEFSYEHGTLGGVGHGIFTYSFLEALRGGARPDEQNLVRLGTVADYVSSRVTEWAKQGGRQPQTPFFAGPEAPRKLPLAVQASNLAALIMSVEKYSTSMDFTPELRSQLVAVLKQLDATREADRRLAVQTREFAAGRLSEFVYVPYLESELRRRRGGVPQPLRAPFDTATARRAQQDWSRFLGTTVTQENSIGMKLALIPAGEFRMGSPENEEERSSGEYQHRVRITKPFYLGVYEVTQGEYERVMGENPSWFSRGGGGASSVSGEDTSRFPVEGVSWEDAVEYCRKLSSQPEERAARRVYRLPTEAEWEYACRSGTSTAFHFGTQLDGRAANCDGNNPYGVESTGPYLGRPTTVGSYTANAFGLYDMHGNIGEWCSDGYDLAYYRSSPVDDPPGPSEASSRVNRGGSWYVLARSCRAAFRHGNSPSNRDYNLGFRVALVPPGQ